MPSIQTAFGAYLAVQSSVTSLLASLDSASTDEAGNVPIYYIRGLQDSTIDPYITYSVPKNEEHMLVGGPADVATATIKVCCISANPDNSQSIAQAVKTLFRFQSTPPVNIGGVSTLGTWIEEESDAPAINDSGLFEAYVDIGIQFYIS